ncbi:hypothetical protein CLU79DRAFT_714715 [Phycomyces nitens]|nr:hypothetical protein CLU79DRAFT_714715 [Phycomyces nitens]
MNGSNEYSSDMEVSDNEELSYQQNPIDAWMQDSHQGQHTQQGYSDASGSYQNLKANALSGRSIHINPALSQMFSDVPYYQYLDYNNKEYPPNNQKEETKRPERLKNSPRVTRTKKKPPPTSLVIEISDESDSGESFVTAPSSPIANRAMTLGDGNQKPENDIEKLQNDLSRTEGELEVVDKELAHMFEKKMELENELLAIKLKDTLKRKKINSRVSQNKKNRTYEPLKNTVEEPKKTPIPFTPQTTIPPVTRSKYVPVAEKKLFMDTVGKNNSNAPINILGISLPPANSGPIKRIAPTFMRPIPAQNKVATDGQSERVSFSISQPMSVPAVKHTPDASSQPNSTKSAFPITEHSTNSLKSSPFKVTITPSSKPKESTPNNPNRILPLADKRSVGQSTNHGSKTRKPMTVFGFPAIKNTNQKVTPQPKPAKKVLLFDLTGDDPKDMKSSFPIRPIMVDYNNVFDKKDANPKPAKKNDGPIPADSHPTTTTATTATNNNKQKFILSMIPGGKPIDRSAQNASSNKVENSTAAGQNNGQHTVVIKDEPCSSGPSEAIKSAILANTSPETPQPKELLTVAQVKESRERAHQRAVITENQPRDHTGISITELLKPATIPSSAAPKHAPVPQPEPAHTDTKREKEKNVQTTDRAETVDESKTTRELSGQQIAPNPTKKETKKEMKKLKKDIEILNTPPAVVTNNGIPEPNHAESSVKANTSAFTTYQSPLSYFGINYQEYQPPQATAKPKQPFNMKSTLCKYEAGGGTSVFCVYFPMRIRYVIITRFVIVVKTRDTDLKIDTLNAMWQ